MNSKNLMNTYKRMPVAFSRGEGAWLWADDGEQYLDAIAGIAVCGLGHGNGELAAALADQAKKLIHTSNLFRIPLQEQLAEELAAVTGMDRVFFSNSGAEANECAIKLARLWGHQRGIDVPTIVVAEGSFHGRTLATLTATGNRKIQAGFEPLVQGFVRVPYNDIEALRNVARNSTNVVAVLLEPIQGEGGIRIPDSDYLNSVRQLCDQSKWLMMLDEIQTGMCRTGRWLAVDHNKVQADVVTLAKALGNGIPIGACLARGAAAEVFQPGNHGSTFGGNPFACRAGLTVLNIMRRDRIAEHAAAMGQYLQNHFTERLGNHPMVKSIRSKGLMLGIELTVPAADMVSLALEQRLLINVTADCVIRLLPPLVINHADADALVDRLSAALAAFAAKH